MNEIDYHHNEWWTQKQWTRETFVVATITVNYGYDVQSALCKLA